MQQRKPFNEIPEHLQSMPKDFRRYFREMYPHLKIYLTFKGIYKEEEQNDYLGSFVTRFLST